MNKIFFTAMIAFVFASPAFADVGAGEKLFKKCKGCHSFEKKKIGPNLTGISKRANPEWLTAWLTDNKKVWAEDGAIVQDLKKRTKHKKSKHKEVLKTPEQVKNMVDFLMTK